MSNMSFSDHGFVRFIFNTGVNSLDLLPSEALLELRLKDLKLKIRDTQIATCIEQLHVELAMKGIRLRPKVYLSDDWFCSDKTLSIAVPFFLAHPSLAKLEKKQTGEVEGGNREWLMKLLRHEMGHVFENAYHLRRNKFRQSYFGFSNIPYPKAYAADPDSQNFVHHLPDHYAQSHPAEDFAETFAVWLNPESDWETVYRDWPALQKLIALEKIVNHVRYQPVKNCIKEVIDPISKLENTLSEHYKNKSYYYSNLHKVALLTFNRQGFTKKVSFPPSLAGYQVFAM